MANLLKFLDSRSKVFLLKYCTAQQIVPLNYTRNFSK
jgi:hypothetical protein